MSSSVLSPESLVDPGEPPDPDIDAFEHLSATVLYLDHDLRKAPLLNAQEEVELAIRIEAGLYAEHKLSTEPEWTNEITRQELELIAWEGREAKALFIQSNLRLVVSNAKRYAGRGTPFLDLIQEGNIGLIRAVEKFDYTKGWKFSTYATWWIRQAISRSFANTRHIRLPHDRLDAERSINQHAGELTVLLGREPTTEELAGRLDIPVQKLREIWETREPLSLDATYGDDERTMLDKVGCTEPGYERAEDSCSSLALAVQEVLDKLTEREATIIRLRLMSARQPTYAEVGQIYGLTPERIRQIQCIAIQKIKAYGSHLVELWHNQDT